MSNGNGKVEMKLTMAEAAELIGEQWGDGSKIIGVDNKPRKKSEGVWLVLSKPNELVSYAKVG